MSQPSPSPRKRCKVSEPSIGVLSRPYFEPPYKLEANGVLTDWYKCRLCAKDINGTKLYNLGSHLERKHGDIYFEKIRPRKKEPLEVKRLRILLNAVEIVSVNGRSFSSLLDSGYQAEIFNKLQKLRAAGIGINFSNANLYEVKENLKKCAEKVRAKIRSELKKKMLSVMVDIGTKNKRAVFGVSVQFIVGKKLIVRSLGLIELEKRHSGKYLSKVLFERLKQYGITKRQVLSITTDNGKNVKKMIRDFDEIDPTCLNTQDQPDLCLANRPLFTEFDGMTEDNVDEEIEQLLSERITDEEALDILFQRAELEENEALLASLSEEFIAGDQIWNTTGVNCVAHTVHLAIGDTLKTLSVTHSNVISLSREIVKFLTKQNTRYEIKEKGFEFKLPRNDCKTRWGSVCIMVCIQKIKILND